MWPFKKKVSQSLSPAGSPASPRSPDPGPVGISFKSRLTAVGLLCLVFGLMLAPHVILSLYVDFFEVPVIDEWKFDEATDLNAGFSEGGIIYPAPVVVNGDNVLDVVIVGVADDVGSFLLPHAIDVNSSYVLYFGFDASVIDFYVDSVSVRLYSNVGLVLSSLRVDTTSSASDGESYSSFRSRSLSSFDNRFVPDEVLANSTFTVDYDVLEKSRWLSDAKTILADIRVVVELPIEINGLDNESYSMPFCMQVSVKHGYVSSGFRIHNEDRAGFLLILCGSAEMLAAFFFVRHKKGSGDIVPDELVYSFENRGG